MLTYNLICCLLTSCVSQTTTEEVSSTSPGLQMSVARFISKRRSQGTSQVSRQIKMTTERLMFVWGWSVMEWSPVLQLMKERGHRVKQMNKPCERCGFIVMKDGSKTKHTLRERVPFCQVHLVFPHTHTHTHTRTDTGCEQTVTMTAEHHTHIHTAFAQILHHSLLTERPRTTPGVCRCVQVWSLRPPSLFHPWHKILFYKLGNLRCRRGAREERKTRSLMFLARLSENENLWEFIMTQITHRRSGSEVRRGRGKLCVHEVLMENALDHSVLFSSTPNQDTEQLPGSHTCPGFSPPPGCQKKHTTQIKLLMFGGKNFTSITTIWYSVLAPGQTRCCIITTIQRFVWLLHLTSSTPKHTYAALPAVWGTNAASVLGEISLRTVWGGC